MVKERDRGGKRVQVQLPKKSDVLLCKLNGGVHEYAEATNIL